MEEVVEWLKITKTQKKRSPEYDEMRIEAPALALVCGDDDGHPVPVPRHKELARGGGPAIGVMAAVVTSVWSHLNRHRDWVMKTNVSYTFTSLQEACSRLHEVIIMVCLSMSSHVTRILSRVSHVTPATWHVPTQTSLVDVKLSDNDTFQLFKSESWTTLRLTTSGSRSSGWWSSGSLSSSWFKSG